MNFMCGNLAVCFARMDINSDFYLLTTIKKVTNDLNVQYTVGYEGEELEKYKNYYGRLIVKKSFQKNDRQRNRWANNDNFINTIEVSQILPSKYDGREFSGYNDVCLSYEELKNIIDNNKTDWIIALSNQKAVYVITDLKTGKLYIGSATSNNGMLLSRWKSYIETGHGDNKKIKELIDDKGFDYIKENFQYSIIENYNSIIDDEIIRKREVYWKNVLDSVDHGMNDNY